PLPTETRAVGAAIVDVRSGYSGPRELRSISSGATDALGNGAPVFHAGTPQSRGLTSARSLRSPRGEFPFSHINDAEIKLWEYLRLNLSPGAEGVVHFVSFRSRQGGLILEPIPHCASCTNATFQLAGEFPGVTLISHTPPFPALTLDLEAALQAAAKGSR
ncbi:MAG: hypothetical protein ACM30G_05865, partial [Micromonosporaceae bacterium]